MSPARGSIDRPDRTFGVEEELLLVDAKSLRPVPHGENVVALTNQEHRAHRLATEFKNEQIEVISPPQTTLEGQLEAIRTGRAAADAAAAAYGARAVAMSTCPAPVTSSVARGARYQRMTRAYGITAVEQLTCGFHVHVGIRSPAEGVAALDRLRVWLPVLLALSSNSPFWMGLDTGFASYRYQVWGRWPTSGPTEVFGSQQSYERHAAALLGSGVPLDDGMLYFDARLSGRFPTVEIRILDVCLLPAHAAALAALVRALVETSVRQWRAGHDAPRVPATVLRAWSWQASRFGMEADLMSPLTRKPTASAEVAAQLIDTVAPVLSELSELEAVAEAISDITASGTGAQRQREFRQSSPETHRHGDLKAIVGQALLATYQAGSSPKPTSPRHVPDEDGIA
mgnify:CR=1 FL=1